MFSERVIETDVLVIGGGMAGFFAAIKAKEQGLDVTITDKGFVGKTGTTHFSEGDTLYFRPQKGHNMKEWIDIISRNGEYLNNRDWDEIVLRECEDRYNDLISWGIRFFEKDGKLYVMTMMNAPTVYENIDLLHRTFAPILRKKALESGILILDRIMICELLKQEGTIVGAVGFNPISSDMYILKAKATVLATGSSNLKGGSYPTQFLSGDGEVMAYRMGAEVTSKEFAYGAPRSRAEVQHQEQLGETDLTGEISYDNVRFPFAIGGGITGWYNMPNVNAEGGTIIHPAWEAHMGRAPLYVDFGSFIYTPQRLDWIREYYNRIEMAKVQTEKIGFDLVKDIFGGGKVQWPASRVMTTSIWSGSGIWPVDKSCAVGVPGLFAAGNACATMGSGVAMAGGGFDSTHATVTGARAGLGAAEFANRSGEITLDEQLLARVKSFVREPLERKGGFSPVWVTQVLHGVTVPYFYLNVKHEKRLKPALEIVEFIKNHLVPQIKVNDTHELRLAHETKNLVTIAEMRFRASLFRTESRGMHFREDYPRRDDPTWLAWVKIGKKDGEMNLTKEPVPQEWWPDLSKPYEERYPRILPLE